MMNEQSPRKPLKLDIHNFTDYAAGTLLGYFYGHQNDCQRSCGIASLETCQVRSAASIE